MKQFIFLFLSIFLLTSFTNNNTITTSEGIITDGENLTYTVSYEMAGILNDIAEIKMETSKIKTKTSEFYRFKCTAATYSQWDSWFRIRDLYESYVYTTSLKPALYNRDIEEGGYIKKVKYKFKRKSGIAETTITKKNNRVKKFNAKIHNDTYDIVSAIYKVRTLDYENFAIGKVIPFKVLVDGKEMHAYLKYKGKENIALNKFGSKECYKVSLSFEKGALEKANGSKNMWITADDKHYIALIKANIPLGTVQIKLTNI